MKQTFDYRESTMSFDYVRRIVEFYFTRESNYQSCLRRNPYYIKAEELNPGYRIIYPFNQCRTPEFLLRCGKKPETIASYEGQKAA